MRIYRLLRLLFAAIFLFESLPFSIVHAASRSQNVSETRLLEIIEGMTPEERVGQLFLVTFKGTDVGPETQIYDLINNHFIGGVILLAQNDNFTASTFNLNDIWTLNTQLQTTRFETSEILSRSLGREIASPPTYIPLLIGISQEGDGYPNDQILSGLTPLPSQLAIGATWNTELAYQVGTVAGRELSDLGFNLIFGPTLDVIENPLLKGASELGVRSFGGDPYWVAEMGSAYIRGLHDGSNLGMAVVGTHFPGLGSADHLPKDEVATVRKSLEQLKQIELAPFFAVTGNAITQTEKVDALLTSHIRYQGLQGNIRSTTRPIGFDQQALSLLMEQPAFTIWREDGGIMISDDLGSRAVRRFYDPTEQEFNARRLALDAFLAGNDLLYLNNFIEPADPDSYTTILRTVEFFTQKYREDPLFAERVDRSVQRILALKIKLYDEFDIENVVTSSDLNQIGRSSQVTYDTAQQGVTLISPAVTELDNVLPEIPGRQERIVIITDSYPVQQCSECPEQAEVPYDALSKAILNLYGPEAGGLVSPFYLRPHTFAELTDLLNGIEENENLITDINLSPWVVFIMLDVNAERPSSVVLNRFLAERPDLYRDKRVIVFAANAPNYLDSTEISKLTAYFGLFSKSLPFIDIAARVLFKEIAQPPGALPVSVPGVGYDLILATSPDPDQIIPISLDIPEWIPSDQPNSPEEPPLPEYHIGETLPLKTGIILDNNNHLVPNNTPVQFNITINGIETLSISAITVDGISRANYIFERSGTHAIQAVSGLATSTTLIFEIPEEAVTPEPTATVTPTDTPTLRPTSTSPPPTLESTPTPQIEESTVGLEDWLGALILATFIGWGASRTGMLLGKVRWGIRWGLSAFIGGLLFYTGFVLELPGSDVLSSLSHTWGFLVATFSGTMIGWIIALSVNLARGRYSEIR